MAILLAVLSGCTGSSGGGPATGSYGEPGTEQNLAEAFSALDRDPQLRALVAGVCAGALEDTEGFKYQSFMAAFFDVSWDRAGTAFCGALFEAIAVEDITEQDLERIGEFAEDPDYRTAGRLMRSLLEANERLSSQSARIPNAPTAQADLELLQQRAER
ncbi:MAG TPA: hypothetical protein EYP07_03545 [Kiloniellaceae bacterium]|nr:hypothetical protein [Kiloniellaceae bacterium]